MSGRRVTRTTAVAVLALGCVAAQGLIPADAGTLPAPAARIASGGPAHGGTLVLLGMDDVINLDTISGYSSGSYLLERMFARGLFGYPESPGLASQLAVAPDIASEIPTASNGGITDGGRTYTIHLKQGVMWGTAPPRQVTSYDFVREFKMLCNPASPVGAPGYYESTIVGMAKYCDGFGKVSDTVSAIADYEQGTPLSGVSAPNPSTVVFRLVEPASDFINILAMGFSDARPVEYMNYLPDSAAFRQHTISDGAYQITSYSPGKGFTLKRNPVWKQSTDTLRHAYVDKVVITEGLTEESVQEQLEAGTGDMEFFVPPPIQDIPGLEDSPNFVVGPGYVTTRQMVLNEFAGPFTNKLVREAAEYAVDKNAIVQIEGGPKVAAVADQLVIPGSTGYIARYDPFPDNNGNGDPAKAKALLKQAGYPHGVTVKMIYSNIEPVPRVAESLQSSFGAAGFHVDLFPVTVAALFGSYLTNPSTARRDAWDMSPARYIPDWFGNNGRTFLQAGFTDPGFGSGDYGGYSSRSTDSLIGRALSAPSASVGARLWSQAERQIMTDAATVPLDYSKWPAYHSSAVHGCSYWWVDVNCDPTNVWLSS